MRADWLPAGGTDVPFGIVPCNVVETHNVRVPYQAGCPECSPPLKIVTDCTSTSSCNLILQVNKSAEARSTEMQEGCDIGEQHLHEGNHVPSPPYPSCYANGIAISTASYSRFPDCFPAKLAYFYYI